MSLVHFHLIIVHLPIVGLALGLLFFSLSLSQRGQDLRKAALLLWLVSAVGVVPAYLSGEEAEEGIEHTAGIDETLIENHEEAALPALVAVLSLGTLSAVASFLQYRNKACPKWLLAALLIVALLAMASISRTGQLGGMIRHSEIR